MSGHRHKAPIGLLCSNIISTLRARREVRGISQKWMAIKLGITRSHLGGLEREARHPSMPMLIHWARELDMHIRLIDMEQK